jgi:phosphonate transport system substrate-binding protein
MPEGRDYLTMGLAPTLGGDQVMRQFIPIRDYLKTALGVDVRLEVTADYESLIRKSINSEVDISLLPPYSYVQVAEKKPDINLLASVLYLGRTRYSGFILVRSSDPAVSLKDLKGRRIAFVDKYSTSGYLLPKHAFESQGISIDSDFSKVIFAGSHAAALDLLAKGEVDAAATSSEMLGLYRREKLHSAKAHRPGLVRILYKTGQLPYDALCATDSVPKSALKKIAAAFLAMHNRNPKAQQALAASASITGWAPPDDSRYDAIRAVTKTTKTTKTFKEGDDVAE